MLALQTRFNYSINTFHRSKGPTATPPRSFSIRCKWRLLLWYICRYRQQEASLTTRRSERQKTYRHSSANYKKCGSLASSTRSETVRPNSTPTITQTSSPGCSSNWLRNIKLPPLDLQLRRVHRAVHWQQVPAPDVACYSLALCALRLALSPTSSTTRRADPMEVW